MSACALCAPAAGACGRRARRLRPVAHGALRRTRAAPAQRGLDRNARRANLRNAFKARRGFDGLHVGIVDGVITTANTTNAVARAGAARISVYALARG